MGQFAFSEGVDDQGLGRRSEPRESTDQDRQEGGRNLPVPLRSIGSVQQMEDGATTSLDASRAAGEGESIRIPAAGAVLLRVAR